MKESFNSETIESSACIDWFKFKVFGTFSRVFSPGTKEHELWLELSDVLRISSNALTIKSPTSKYGQRYIADASISIMAEPRGDAQRLDDRDYYLVDMSGSSCREFEERGGSWLELLKFYLDHFTEFEGHRIDLAMDDFKYMTMASILRQVEKGCYTGVFKGAYSPTESISDFLKVIEVEDVDRSVYKKMKKDGTIKGLSITWGSKESNSSQFQIYDKRLERIVAGKKVDVKNWIRFENRFFRSHTDDVIEKLYQGMTSVGLAPTIAGILSGRFNLLTHSYKNHPDRVPRWKPWSDFIGSVEAIPIDRVAQRDIENRVSRSIRFISRSTPRSMTRIFLADPSEWECSNAELVVRYVLADEKFSAEELAQINYYRSSMNKSMLSMDEAEACVNRLKVKYGITFEDPTDEDDQRFTDDSDLPF